MSLCLSTHNNIRINKLHICTYKLTHLLEALEISGIITWREGKKEYQGMLCVKKCFPSMLATEVVWHEVVVHLFVLNKSPWVWKKRNKSASIPNMFIKYVIILSVSSVFSEVSRSCNHLELFKTLYTVPICLCILA